MIKVLSLFNGMNCIGLALHSLGIEFELYASEIDKYANKVSNTLFPGTINLGDVRTVKPSELPAFDLIVGGSPCQGFSFAGKQLNFEDERSKLFFEFVRIWKACKKKNPNIKFLLENVKMKKESEAVISRFMGIDPILINSALLSAQNRERLYWTNIGTTKANLFGIEQPGIIQPKDKGVLLKDVLEKEFDEKYILKLKTLNYLKSPTKSGKFNGRFEPRNALQKAVCLTSRCFKMGRTDNYIKVNRKGKRKGNQQKASCLTVAGNSGGNHSDMDVLFIENKQGPKFRRLTPTECARLQTVPEWAIEKMLNCGVSDTQLYKMLGNGWTVEVISYILSHHFKTKNNA